MHILVVEDERALCDTLIYRMLFNLIENAIRYNRPDSRVQISVSEKNDDVLIRVKDNGFGIPEQYRESIFKRSSVSINHAAESTAESVRTRIGLGNCLAPRRHGQSRGKRRKRNGYARFIAEK